MPSNTENDRNRAYLASVLRLLFGPVALLVLFHAEPVSALSPVVVLIAAPSESSGVDAGALTEAELPLCDLTDSSLAVAPGSCAAVPAEAVPAEAVPAEAVPAEAVPAEAVPAEAVPPEAVPAEAVPPEAVPPEAVPPEAVAHAAQEEVAKVPADKAPAVKAAPMCASDATSIAAPVEIPEVDRGYFAPLPCDAQALLALFGSQARDGNAQLMAARQSPPRVPSQSPALNDGSDGFGALSMPLHWPERAAPSTLAPHWSGGLAWQPGHRSRIDRPPSLRARASLAYGRS